MSVLWTVLVSCLAALAGSDQNVAFQSLNMSPIDSEMWGLPPAHLYPQIVEITANNFESNVMESDDVWILICHRNIIRKKWNDMAKRFGGAVLFGRVDINKHSNLPDLMKINVQNIDEGDDLAVVFPLKNGRKYNQMEEGMLKSSSNLLKALQLASTYIPDKTIDLTFSEDQMQKFNDWVVRGYYYEQPPKFPVICIIDEMETPIHVKVAAHYLATHFHFGIVRKENIPTMRKAFKQVPDPQTFPTFLVLLGIEPTTEEMNAGSFQMRFNIMPYIEQKYGDPRSLSSLINFLFVANSDYRTKLPGREPTEPAEVSNMAAIRGKLTERFRNLTKKSRRAHKSEL